MSKELKAKVTLDVKSATKKLDLLAKKINALDKAVNKRSSVSKGITQQIENSTKSVRALDSANKQAAKSANNIAKGYKNANSAVSILTKNLRTLVSTYLGVMGAKAVIGVSDTLTSAKNRLNALPAGTQNNTQESLDKMYAASMRSRTGYADMMANVSKSMTLAPDAFQGNIDNAIRFQEIMGKTYALGGASAAEQSSSMYQMIQALGSGRLQGDELSSVREGAPLAYQAIEKFAQGIYGSEENLKDLASQGKITSDIVVAAMLQMGDEVDAKFAETAMTFAQAGEMIKNTATKSFEPVLQRLNDALNSDFGKSVINGIGYSLQILAGVVSLVFDGVSALYNFIVNNWPIISKVLMTIATIMTIAIIPKIIAWLGYLGFIIMYYSYVAGAAVASAVAAASAWIMANLPLFIMLALLALLIVAIICVSDTFVDAAGNIVGVLAAAISIIWNLFVTLATLVIQAAVLPMLTAFDLFANLLGNIFNDPISAIIYSFEGLAQSVLGILKTIANGIDAIFGSNLSDAVSGWQDKIKGKADSLASKYGNGTYKQKSNQAEQLNSLLDSVQTKISWNTGNAFNSGYKIGASGGQWISDKVRGIGSSLIGNLPSSAASNLAIAGAYDPAGIGKNIGKTADNTGKIADSMELTQEDLEYLRKVADMEWKKEFTTANITVDMSNYNTINGESDIDGIVTKLTDKLYEELDYVANGVYV